MMKIGYLHIGAAKHGIRRYSLLIAAEAKTRSTIGVIEAAVTLTGTVLDQVALKQAARQLSVADVVHIQYNSLIWGRGWTQLANLKTFLRHCSAPIVVTLHDIFYPPSSASLLQRWIVDKQRPNLKDLGKAILRDRVAPHILALQTVMQQAKVAFVCTHEEAVRLRDRNYGDVKVIPHFVEARQINLSRTEARQALKLENATVITLLGFIYKGKGHPLLIEALAQIPEAVVVFAGQASAGHEAYLQSLIELAEAYQVRDRLRVTGYLSEPELERYLIATDLAVCPFQQTSASGSLSTWLSVDRPILAFEIPQVKEYNALQPNAIQTFREYTAEALLAAIQTLIAQRHSPLAQTKLRQQLSISAIFDRHLQCYFDHSKSDHTFITV